MVNKRFGVGISGALVVSTLSVSSALRGIYGIGRSRSEFLCNQVGVFVFVRMSLLKKWQFDLLRHILYMSFILESELRQQIFDSIDHLKFIKCYRGQRHRFSLPCRGQRTRSNARTQKRRRRGSSVE